MKEGKAIEFHRAAKIDKYETSKVIYINLDALSSFYADKNEIVISYAGSDNVDRIGFGSMSDYIEFREHLSAAIVKGRNFIVLILPGKGG